MNVALETGLSADAIEKRKASIGGSDANIIMSGDDKRILALWEVKTGLGGFSEPEDLTWVLPVQMGIQTEPLNRKWFEHVTGMPVGTHRAMARVHPEYPWMTCTLDGWVQGQDDDYVFEAKHVNQFSKLEEVRQRYMPQLHHNMMVTGWRKAYLSVFIGTMTHAWCEVEYDDWYAGELLEREVAFWNAVQRGEPPVSLGDPIAAPALDDMREVDMTGSNEWAFAAGEWLENKMPAALFDAAGKVLKKMMEADVRLASGHGVKCTRAKNGSLRISEVK